MNNQKKRRIIAIRELVIKALMSDSEYAEDLKGVWKGIPIPRTYQQYLDRTNMVDKKSGKVEKRIVFLKERSDKLSKKFFRIKNNNKRRDEIDAQVGRLEDRIKKWETVFYERNWLERRILEFQRKWGTLPILPLSDDPEDRFLPVVRDAGELPKYRGSGWRMIAVNMLWSTDLIKEQISSEISRISKGIKSPFKNRADSRNADLEKQIEALSLANKGYKNSEIVLELEPIESRNRSAEENRRRGCRLKSEGKKFLKEIKGILFGPKFQLKK